MMRKATKIWLITATMLLVLGTGIFALAAAAVGFDLTRLSTQKYETNVYVPNEEFSNVSIKADTADISLVPSEDGVCKVSCYEREKVKHSVTVRDGTLVIDVVDGRAWYDYIGIDFGSPKITVSLPRSAYGVLTVKGSTGDVTVPKELTLDSIDISVSTGDVFCYASATDAVKITASTGDIRAEQVRTGTLALSVSTGDITATGIVCADDALVEVSTGKTSLSDMTCRNFTSRGDTGDIQLKNLVATEKLLIERSTGDVRLDGCDAAELFIKTDTGDVAGTLLSEKVFVTETDTGKEQVPNTAGGGRCEIITDTGDIKISLKQ